MFALGTKSKRIQYRLNEIQNVQAKTKKIKRITSNMESLAYITSGKEHFSKKNRFHDLLGGYIEIFSKKITLTEDNTQQHLKLSFKNNELFN